jgi:hypothetical protein
VAAANLGTYDAAQLRQNAQWVKDFHPLSPDEGTKLAELGRELAPKWGEHGGAVTEAEPPLVRTS